MLHDTNNILPVIAACAVAIIFIALYAIMGAHGLICLAESVYHHHFKREAILVRGDSVTFFESKPVNAYIPEQQSVEEPEHFMALIPDVSDYHGAVYSGPLGRYIFHGKC
jgi:hypothetical protein